MRDVQMGNQRGMIGVNRMDKWRNEYILNKWGIEKGVDAIIDESILR